MTRPYSGIWPVAPTPFTEDGALDLEGMKRVIDCMVDQKVDGICILANFSEQFLLSDEERAAVTRVSLEQCAGRVPVIVTVSHFATQIVEARAREAAAMGAAMLMLMPPYHGALLRADEEGIFEHFERAGKAGGSRSWCRTRRSRERRCRFLSWFGWRKRLKKLGFSRSRRRRPRGSCGR